MRRTLTAIAAAAVLGTAACQGDDPVAQSSSIVSPPATTPSVLVPSISSPSLLTSATATATPAAAAAATTSATSPPASASAGQLIEIAVSGGKVQTEDKTVKVKQGSTVTLRVTSDVADKVHLHGYDVERDVTPGTPMMLTFTADQPGGFEVELEGAQLRLVTLRVS